MCRITCQLCVRWLVLFCQCESIDFTRFASSCSSIRHKRKVHTRIIHMFISFRCRLRTANDWIALMAAGFIFVATQTPINLLDNNLFRFVVLKPIGSFIFNFISLWIHFFPHAFACFFRMIFILVLSIETNRFSYFFFFCVRLLGVRIFVAIFIIYFLLSPDERILNSILDVKKVPRTRQTRKSIVNRCLGGTMTKRKNSKQNMEKQEEEDENECNL